MGIISLIREEIKLPSNRSFGLIFALLFFTSSSKDLLLIIELIFPPVMNK